mgnify:CR=1 FL=1
MTIFLCVIAIIVILWFLAKYKLLDVGEAIGDLLEDFDDRVELNNFFSWLIEIYTTHKVHAAAKSLSKKDCSCPTNL